MLKTKNDRMRSPYLAALPRKHLWTMANRGGQAVSLCVEAKKEGWLDGTCAVVFKIPAAGTCAGSIREAGRTNVKLLACSKCTWAQAVEWQLMTTISVYDCIAGLGCHYLLVKKFWMAGLWHCTLCWHCIVCSEHLRSQTGTGTTHVFNSQPSTAIRDSSMHDHSILHIFSTALGQLHPPTSRCTRNTTNI